MAEQLTPSELLAIEIRKDRESWLERENFHLEGQLENEKRDTDMQRKMARHYAMRNKIARAKLKRAHAKIRALTEAKEKEKLNILAEVSLQAPKPQSTSKIPILALFCTF